jgi:hypothetical protein
MTDHQLIDRIRTDNLRRITGWPDHWLTTFHTGFWGINNGEGNVTAWKGLAPGSLCFFHAQGSTGWDRLPNSIAKSGIIGVGVVSHTDKKETLEWIVEIEEEQNSWPHLIHFEQIWWFSDTSQIEDEPIRTKMQRGPRSVRTDVARLVDGRLRFGEIEQRTGYRFPAQGSISGLDPTEEQQEAIAQLVEEMITGVRYYSHIEDPEDKRVRESKEEYRFSGSGRNQVHTGSYETNSTARLGQDAFSDEVRDNFGHQCCFPGCEVSDDRYLIGAHIARWADEPDMRGEVTNGLCLCLPHDKAFEIGHYTLDSDYRIWTTDSKIENSQWAQEHIAPHIGEQIKAADQPPHPKALEKHWERHGFSFEDRRS